MYRKVRDNLSLITDWLNKADVAISIERTVNDSTRAKVFYMFYFANLVYVFVSSLFACDYRSYNSD